ncbi:cytochrome c [Aquibacillus sp. 3ASR75-11]|uniref:Cytochrome c n=1 Tax=Terrihalobacillus insolitus TaxID=2950438 RepID=A0A9X3WS07_9BACI|nr:cytochrome c [Terrihalobacillus insolitus]MDC3413364.1 cytochrome c [Terrihalobacillus insolitus]MDC3424947.1 cytochrome c [Terrihalobacillus insolitus]
MRKNPVVPYAMIAVLGILVMIVLSFIGANQQDKIEQAQENGGETQEEGGGEEGGGDVVDPEEYVQNSCVSCHGSDLSGGIGPDLRKIGNKYSKDEIKKIVMNGIEGTAMPAVVKNDAQAEAIAKWLAEKK